MHLQCGCLPNGCSLAPRWGARSCSAETRPPHAMPSVSSADVANVSSGTVYKGGMLKSKGGRKNHALSSPALHGPEPHAMGMQGQRHAPTNMPNTVGALAIMPWQKKSLKQLNNSCRSAAETLPNNPGATRPSKAAALLHTKQRGNISLVRHHMLFKHHNGFGSSASYSLTRSSLAPTAHATSPRCQTQHRHGIAWSEGRALGHILSGTEPSRSKQVLHCAGSKALAVQAARPAQSA